MKTLKILSTLMIAAVSMNAFADGHPDDKNRKTNKEDNNTISLPAMHWGNPADVQAASIAALRNTYYLFDAPEMNWGSAEEVNAGSIEALKNIPMLAAPEMVWGNPEDATSASVEQLKKASLVSYPEIVWGDPEDVNIMRFELADYHASKTSPCNL